VTVTDGFTKQGLSRARRRVPSLPLHRQGPSPAFSIPDHGSERDPASQVQSRRSDRLRRRVFSGIASGERVEKRRKHASGVAPGFLTWGELAAASEGKQHFEARPSIARLRHNARSAMARGRDQQVRADFFGDGSHRSRLRRYSGASAETSDYCTKAAIGLSLPFRFGMNARMDEGELRDRGRAQHERIKIR
jgi:hypothetical protein